MWIIIDKYSPSHLAMGNVLEVIAPMLYLIFFEINKIDWHFFFEIVINIIFGLIIIFFTIYEIINHCKKKKKKNIYINNYNNLDKVNKIKYLNNFTNSSNKESTTTISNQEKNLGKIANSFHSSIMSERSNNKEEFNNKSSNIQISNLDESIKGRDIDASGYEAPIIDASVQKDKEDKYYTNDGNENKKNKKTIQLLNNPY